MESAKLTPATAREERPLESILRQIIQDPDGDRLRLRFADTAALIPELRPWSEFIRIQLQQTSLAASLDTPAGFALLRRARTLWAEYGSRWVHPLWQQLNLGKPQFAHFHRGFLELVEAPDFRIVEAGEQILASGPVRHVNVTSLDRYELGQVVAAIGGQQVRSLSLECLSLTGGQLRQTDWSRLPGLRWISLAGNDSLGQEDFARLAEVWRKYLPELTHVNFDGCGADPCERLLYDQDAVAGSRQPDWARQMETGEPLRWLHPRVIHGRPAMVDRMLLAHAA